MNNHVEGETEEILGDAHEGAGDRDHALEMYDARKEAKDYLEFYLLPNCEVELEKCKKAIKREFFPARGIAMNPSLSKCKKIVSDFQKLNANPSHTADLILFFIEQGSEYSAKYGGDMGEPFCTVLVNNFRKYIYFHERSVD